MESNIPYYIALNDNPSFFSATVHVTYHRDLEAHYLALLNITANIEVVFPSRTLYVSLSKCDFLNILHHSHYHPSTPTNNKHLLFHILSQTSPRTTGCNRFDDTVNSHCMVHIQSSYSHTRYTSYHLHFDNLSMHPFDNR